jgi:hypothetical protein
MSDTQKSNSINTSGGGASIQVSPIASCRAPA